MGAFVLRSPPYGRMGLTRLRDDRGNSTDFWLSTTRSSARVASTSTSRARGGGEWGAVVEREVVGVRALASRVGVGGALARDSMGASNDVEPNDDDDDDDDDDADIDFAHAPVVFVGYPHVSLLCPRCRDVMLDPVCADDGSSYCRGCAPAPTAAGAPAYARNVEIEDAIVSSAVICRRGLVLKRNAHGAGEWCWNAEGCGEAVRLSMRDVHDRECQFVSRRCPFPCASMTIAQSHNLVPGKDFCGECVPKYLYISHQQSCAWQPTTCEVKGCAARVPLCKAPHHAQTCPEAVIACANGCGWSGARKSLAEHRATTCVREYIKCGFINLEDEDELGCLFGCERAGIDAHRMDCDYRPYTCPSCDTKVNALRAARHEAVCAEARRPCPKCHAFVRSKILHAHLDNFCVGASKKCPFVSFGCLECGTTEELVAHQRDDAPRHLRLVVRALDEERERGTKKTQVIERLEASIEDLNAECERLAREANDRVRFVEEKAIEQVQRVQNRLELTTEAFDAHVAAQTAEIARLKIDLTNAVDADAQLTKVTSAVSHEDANALVASIESHAMTCTAQIMSLRAEIDACDVKWNADVEQLSTRDEDTVAACRKEIDSAIRERRERDTSTKRLDELAAEIRDVQRTLNIKLMELSQKQNELNEHWRIANQNPQFVLTTRVAPSLTGSEDDVENQERTYVDVVKPRRKLKTLAKTLASDENVSNSGDGVTPLRRRKFSASLRSARDRVPDESESTSSQAADPSNEVLATTAEAPREEVADDERVLSTAAPARESIARDIEPPPSQTSPVQPMEEARTRSAVHTSGAVADDERVLSTAAPARESIARDIEPPPSQTSPVQPMEEARTHSAVHTSRAPGHGYDDMIRDGLMREYETVYDDRRDLNVSYDDTVSLSSSVSIDDVDDEDHGVIRAVDFADLLGRRL